MADTKILTFTMRAAGGQLEVDISNTSGAALTGNKLLIDIMLPIGLVSEAIATAVRKPETKTSLAGIVPIATGWSVWTQHAASRDIAQIRIANYLKQDNPSAEVSPAALGADATLTPRIPLRALVDNTSVDIEYKFEQAVRGGAKDGGRVTVAIAASAEGTKPTPAWAPDVTLSSDQQNPLAIPFKTVVKMSWSVRNAVSADLIGPLPGGHSSLRLGDAEKYPLPDGSIEVGVFGPVTYLLNAQVRNPANPSGPMMNVIRSITFDAIRADQYGSFNLTPDRALPHAKIDIDWAVLGVRRAEVRVGGNKRSWTLASVLTEQGLSGFRQGAGTLGFRAWDREEGGKVTANRVSMAVYGENGRLGNAIEHSVDVIAWEKVEPRPAFTSRPISLASVRKTLMLLTDSGLWIAESGVDDLWQRTRPIFREVLPDPLGNPRRRLALTAFGTGFVVLVRTPTDALQFLRLDANGAPWKDARTNQPVLPVDLPRDLMPGAFRNGPGDIQLISAGPRVYVIFRRLEGTTVPHAVSVRFEPTAQAVRETALEQLGGVELAYFAGALYALDRSTGAMRRFDSVSDGPLKIGRIAREAVQNPANGKSTVQDGVVVPVGDVLVVLTPAGIPRFDDTPGVSRLSAERAEASVADEAESDQDVVYNPQKNRWATCGHGLDIPPGAVAAFREDETSPRLWVLFPNQEMYTLPVGSPDLFARDYRDGWPLAKLETARPVITAFHGEVLEATNEILVHWRVEDFSRGEIRIGANRVVPVTAAASSVRIPFERNDTNSTLTITFAAFDADDVERATVDLKSGWRPRPEDVPSLRGSTRVVMNQAYRPDAGGARRPLAYAVGPHDAAPTPILASDASYQFLEGSYGFKNLPDAVRIDDISLSDDGDFLYVLAHLIEHEDASFGPWASEVGQFFFSNIYALNTATDHAVISKVGYYGIKSGCRFVAGTGERMAFVGGVGYETDMIMTISARSAPNMFDYGEQPYSNQKIRIARLPPNSLGGGFLLLSEVGKYRRTRFLPARPRALPQDLPEGFAAPVRHIREMKATRDRVVFVSMNGSGNDGGIAVLDPARSYAISAQICGAFTEGNYWIDVTADGLTLFVANENGTIAIVDGRSHHVRQVVHLPAPLRGIVASPDIGSPAKGKVLVSRQGASGPEWYLLDHVLTGGVGGIAAPVPPPAGIRQFRAEVQDSAMLMFHCETINAEACQCWIEPGHIWAAAPVSVPWNHRPVSRYTMTISGPDGQILDTASLRAQPAAAGRVIQGIDDVHDLAISPDSSWAFVLASNKAGGEFIHVLRLDNGTIQRSVPLKAGLFRRIIVATNGHTIYVSSQYGVVEEHEAFLDVNPRTMEFPSPSRFGGVAGLAMQAADSADPWVYIYLYNEIFRVNAYTKNRVDLLTRLDAQIMDVAVFQNGDLAVSLGEPGVVLLDGGGQYSVKARTPTSRKGREGEYKVSRAVGAGHGKVFAMVGDRYDEIGVFDAQDNLRECAARIAVPDYFNRGRQKGTMTVHPDGATVYVSSSETIAVLDAVSARVRETIPMAPGVNCLAITGDGQWMLVGRVTQSDTGRTIAGGLSIHAMTFAGGRDKAG